MGYHQQYILWFLLLGLIPIVIHWLMRLRVKRVRWGAMYLLGRAIARLVEGKKWWYYLLLASRAAVGLLLAYAFARPFLRNEESATLASGQTHHVILIDNSYSTACTAGEGSIFENGQVLLAALTDHWPRGEKYSVYTLAGGLAPLAVGARMEDARAIAQCLAKARLRDGDVDTVRSIQDVQQRCVGEAVEIILVGDTQGTNWKNADGVSPRQGQKYLWLQPGPTPGPNLALTALSVPGEAVLKGDLIQVVARVQCSRNTMEPQPVTCELALPGQVGQRKSTTVLPGQTRDIPFDIRLERIGIYALKAEIKTLDGLDWDNRIMASVSVRETLNLLILDDIRDRAFDSAVDFMKLLTANAQSPGLRIVAGQASDWDKLDQFDVVVLDNPIDLWGKRQAALEKFVRRGGGVIVFCGPNLNVAAQPTKETFWPVRFGPHPALLPTAGAKFWVPLPSSLTSAHMQALNSQDADGLGNAKVFGYWPADPLPGSVVLGRLDNGAVWMGGRSVGFGRILVLTSGLSGIWNNLPVRGSFVHLVHRLAAYAAEGLNPRLNVGRGEEIVAFEPSSAVSALSGPIGQGEQPVGFVMSSAVREGWQIKTYAGPLARNGLYVLRSVQSGVSRERLVCVYDQRRESDVTPLDEGEQARIIGHFHWSVVKNRADLNAYLERSGGREIYAWLMGGLLATLFIESLLSRKVGS